MTENLNESSQPCAPRSGLLLIDKSAGLTSHFVVSRIKRILKVDKVGHLGTLDPFASGLLPILVGGVTRLADNIMDGKKTYLFTIEFGVETDTLDPTGRVIATADVPVDYALRTANALKDFRGDIEQVPPIYSALKMNGMPLYEHMRGTGKLPVDIESKRRIVRIDSIECVSFDDSDAHKRATLRVTCGKGTYIRSLARDIAKAIGTVGSCCELRREFVEPWHVRDALAFHRESVFEAQQIVPRLVPAQAMLPKLHELRLNAQESHYLNAGNPFYLGVDEFRARCDMATIPPELFVSFGDILFLAEASQVENRVRVQPRKKIC